MANIKIINLVGNRPIVIKNLYFLEAVLKY